MNALKFKYNITTDKSFQETVDGVELVLIRADFAIEFAQPLLPGMFSSTSLCRTVLSLKQQNVSWFKV